MKTAKYYSAVHKTGYEPIEQLIITIQTEAIEVTVKACADAAKVKREKLNNSDCSNFCVDKQSILDVAKQLKSKQLKSKL